MYIDSISLENVRTFTAAKSVSFVHPDKHFSKIDENGFSPPRLTNVNLLFGDNASGKTTLLEAIALATLGPAITDSRVSPRPLVRFVPKTRRSSPRDKTKTATIDATLVLHESELLDIRSQSPSTSGNSHLVVTQKGELERFDWEGSANINWEGVYRSGNESFFVVAYGATRRVEQKIDAGVRKGRPTSFLRVNRIEGIVQEGYPLIPFQGWLPQIKRGSSRWTQIVDLINSALGRGHFVFDGKDDHGDYVFSQGGLDIPFRSLSDGYRAYLSWLGDLLYHLDFACRRSELSIVEVPGVVLVDEIDLHLHPRWQMDVIQHLSKTFPRLQFIFTSHSPLIAGSVEWMNITHLHLDKQHRTGVARIEQPINGLDADQILVTDLFGLKTTRASHKVLELESLQQKARGGDKDAARQLILAMSQGSEAAR